MKLLELAFGLVFLANIVNFMSWIKKCKIATFLVIFWSGSTLIQWWFRSVEVDAETINQVVAVLLGAGAKRVAVEEAEIVVEAVAVRLGALEEDAAAEAVEPGGDTRPEETEVAVVETITGNSPSTPGTIRILGIIARRRPQQITHPPPTTGTIFIRTSGRPRSTLGASWRPKCSLLVYSSRVRRRDWILL